MLFNTLVTLGFATLAAAAPQSHSKFERDPSELESAGSVERGLVWEPRTVQYRDNSNNDKNKNDKNKNRNNRDVLTITQLTETVLTVDQRGQEVQFAQLIEEKIKIEHQSRKDKDHIRKNHFRNKNSSQNTVIIVVTQVIDARDSSNRNTRYMARQIHSNDKVQAQQIVIVSESATVTVGSEGGSRVRRQLPTGTGSVSPVIMTFDPNAAPSLTNSTMILPAGIAAPAYDGTPVEQDPASILDDNTAAFVQFVPPS